MLTRGVGVKLLSDVYLEPYETSMMETFHKNSSSNLLTNFAKKKKKKSILEASQDSKCASSKSLTFFTKTFHPSTNMIFLHDKL